jgi:hypothetical protein
MVRPLLKFGASGADVLLLQQALNLDKSGLPQLVEDGLFGSKTRGRVLEFQGFHGLSKDGIVGPNTHGALEEFYKILQGFLQNQPPAGLELQVRQRIIAAVQSQLMLFGWAPGLTPGPTNPRIAARFCADPATRLRQGGPALTAIFGTAGAGASPTQRCMTIDADVEKMDPGTYQSQRKTLVALGKDLPDWCGIFTVFVYKSAGVPIKDWVQNPYNPFVHDDFVQVNPNQLQPGDIGIVEPFPNRRNHHFIVISVNGPAIRSIDGNTDAESIQTISVRNYQVLSTVIKKDPNNPQRAGFDISSSQGLEKALFLAPNFKKMSGAGSGGKS